ncbi:MAG TPA: HNH endonuclease signature motif containing protein [Mycobacterium sp.]|nr:HNH endonuclease signature motif containing protein [Mycobacterium sp.]
MHSTTVDRPAATITAALSALDDAVGTLLETDFTGLSTNEQVEVLARVEQVARRLPAVGYRLIDALSRGATPAQLGTTLPRALADALRISPREAKQRVADAEKLGPRQTLDGQPLPPELTDTAAAQASGRIGAGHVRVIRDFFHNLPGAVDFATRERAEHDLAELACGLRPDQLAKVAVRMELALNPDGDFSDTDRDRRRGLTLGPQQSDGMSSVRGVITPECRAALEAVLSRWAAPGMCDPADESPTADGDPGPRAETDGRSTTQRNHDALVAICRSVLSSGELGSHLGLPVTIVVSTTLDQLEKGAGVSVTGGGTLVPMSDLIRMASHAYHYLAVYDRHTEIPLYLGRTRRTASPGQRLVLHSKDRGCTRPGCTAPGYLCEVHHVTEWLIGGRTDIDGLTFACKPDHRLLSQGWKVVKNAIGQSEWIPPPDIDTGQARVNDFHHPERLLRPDESPDGGPSG